MSESPDLISWCIFAPFWLGILLIWAGFSVNNGLAWYFETMIEEEGWSSQSISAPIIILIVAGFLTIFSTFFFILVLSKENRKLLLLSVLFIGSTLALQIVGITLLMKNSVDEVPEKTMIDSMAKYYAQDSHPNKSSIHFWDYMQTNLECCGIHSYTDWIAAAQAPAIGFIPKSCCKVEFEKCTWTITHDTINSVAFVEQLVFTEGCRTNFNKSYSIGVLELLAMLMVFFQAFGFVVGLVVLIMTYLDNEESSILSGTSSSSESVGYGSTV